MTTGLRASSRRRIRQTGAMRTESLGDSYLASPMALGPHPGVVVIHEASGLNDNIRAVCRRFAEHGYAALGVDLFGGWNRVVCMARMFIGGRGRSRGASGRGAARLVERGLGPLILEVAYQKNSAPWGRHLSWSKDLLPGG